LISLGSESDSGDGVIEVGSARGGVEDTSGVTLEGVGVSFDGNGNWSLSNSGHKLGNRVGLDVLVSVVEDVVGLLVAARSGSGLVGVLSLELGAVSLQEVESVVLPSTIATVRGFVAIDELLLGEGVELSGLDELSSLEG